MLILAPLRGPSPKGHKLPQFSGEHGIWVMVGDAELYTVVVNPVTEQPLVVTVVDGEHMVVVVVVGNVEPMTVIVEGVHNTVTCSAVSVAVHDDDLASELAAEVVAEVVAEFLLDVFEVMIDWTEYVFWLALLLSLSSVRSSFCNTRLSRIGSIPSTSLAPTISVMSSRFSSMQDNASTTSLKGSSRPLLTCSRAMHGLGEVSPPRSEIRSLTSLLMSSILLSVSVLSDVGFAFQELMTGIKPEIWEDTEETADVT